MSRPPLAAAAAALGRKGGSSRSLRKAEAARRNGALAPPPPHRPAAGDWYLATWIITLEASDLPAGPPLPLGPNGPWRGLEAAENAALRYFDRIRKIDPDAPEALVLRFSGPYRTKREALRER